MTWSEEHYRYRAADIRELSALFDEVIAELRVAAGDTQLTLDLRSGPVDPVYDRVVAPPGLRESIALALAAARATDVAEDRVAVLRSVTALLDREPGGDDLRGVGAHRVRRGGRRRARLLDVGQRRTGGR